MGLLIVSFIAGVVTVLSPRVLPLLPIIVGGSLTEKNRWRPLIVTGSLSLSIVLFTLLLKWSTALINVPQSIWTSFSGGIILVLGVITLWPQLWEHLSTKLKLSNSSNKLLAQSSQRQSWIGAVLVGASLGPVFSSCSPTYAVIVATILPQSFAVGLVNLLVYAAGLSVVLLLVAIFGQKVVAKLQWAANPKGWFKRILGTLFIVVGLLIIFGFEKKIETYFVENGLFYVSSIEQNYIENME